MKKVDKLLKQAKKNVKEGININYDTKEPLLSLFLWFYLTLKSLTYLRYSGNVWFLVPIVCLLIIGYDRLYRLEMFEK